MAKEKPNEWFYSQRAFPFEQINQQAYLHALKQAQILKQEAKASRNTGQWEFAGPINTGGRLSDVEMHASDLRLASPSLHPPLLPTEDHNSGLISFPKNPNRKTYFHLYSSYVDFSTHSTHQVDGSPHN